MNPILATLLPLALSAPRGFSISTDALRLSLLAIAATHQAYLLSKSGTPGPVLSKSLDLAIGLRTDARVLARSADSKVRGDKGDALFAATVVLGIVDILLGGHAWTQNFDLAKAIVANRGGVEAMLAASASITLKEGVEVSRTRLLLESESRFLTYISHLSVLLILLLSRPSPRHSRDLWILRHRRGPLAAPFRRLVLRRRPDNCPLVPRALS